MSALLNKLNKIKHANAGRIEDIYESSIFDCDKDGNILQDPIKADESQIEYEKSEESKTVFPQYEDFIKKYYPAITNSQNLILLRLSNNLSAIASDIQWIKESGNEHEQWALDFVDAINEMSVSL